MNAPREKLVNWLKTTLASGLLVVTPVLVTGWLLWKLLSLLDGFLSEPVGLLLAKLGIETWPEQRFYGLGLVALFVLLLFVGWVARLYIGKRLLALTNEWFEKLPVISTIYSTIQPLSRAVFGDSKTFFREVVWVPYQSGKTLGFLIGDAPTELRELEGKEMVSVYLPFAPPTTGMLLYIDYKTLSPSGMSVEDGLKLLFSFGVVQQSETTT